MPVAAGGEAVPGFTFVEFFFDVFALHVGAGDVAEVPVRPVDPIAADGNLIRPFSIAGEAVVDFASIDIGAPDAGSRGPVDEGARDREPAHGLGSGDEVRDDFAAVEVGALDVTAGWLAIGPVDVGAVDGDRRSEVGSAGQEVLVRVAAVEVGAADRVRSVVAGPEDVGAGARRQGDGDKGEPTALRDRTSERDSSH